MSAIESGGFKSRISKDGRFAALDGSDLQTVQGGGWDTPSTGCKSEGGCGEMSASDWFYDACWKLFFY